jgi:hypothetical protein
VDPLTRIRLIQSIVVSNKHILDGAEAIAEIAENDEMDEVDPAGLLSMAHISQRTPAVERIVTLLSATAHWAIPGLQTGGAFADWRDDGFKGVFQITNCGPTAQSRSDILTAVGMGLVPEIVERPVALLIKANRYSAGIEGRVKRFLGGAIAESW